MITDIRNPKYMISALKLEILLSESIFPVVGEEGVESVGLVKTLRQFINPLAFRHAVEIG